MPLKIWWVGWDGKRAHLQRRQTSKKKSPGKWGIAFTFVSRYWGSQSVEPKNKLCCHLGSDTHNLCNRNKMFDFSLCVLICKMEKIKCILVGIWGKEIKWCNLLKHLSTCLSYKRDQLWFFICSCIIQNFTMSTHSTNSYLVIYIFLNLVEIL